MVHGKAPEVYQKNILDDNECEGYHTIWLGYDMEVLDERFSSFSSDVNADVDSVFVLGCAGAVRWYCGL